MGLESGNEMMGRQMGNTRGTRERWVVGGGDSERVFCVCRATFLIGHDPVSYSIHIGMVTAVIAQVHFLPLLQAHLSPLSNISRPVCSVGDPQRFTAYGQREGILPFLLLAITSMAISGFR
jgi:hypothetical protein